MWRRRDTAWMLGLSGVALVVRLVVVSVIGPRGYILNDSTFYLATARSLAEGHGYAIEGTPTAQWPPGYSTLLSLVFRVTGFSEYAAQVVNAVLGALTVLLLYVLVRRLFGHAGAVVAAGILAVLPGPVLWTDVVVAETFYTCVLVGVLLLFAVLPMRWWTPVVLGLVIGLATFVRGEGLLLIPAAMVVFWYRGRREGVRWGLPGLTRWAGAVALLVVVFALTLVPWGLRNSRAMGQFIPLSTNSSITLWSGHNPRATGAQTYAGPDLIGNLPPGRERELQEASILRSQAVKYARSHPSRELQLIPLKLINLMRGDGYVMDWVNAGPQADDPVPTNLDNPLRTISDAAFFFVFGTAVLAMVLGRRRLWRSAVMAGIAALLLCSLVLYGFVYYGNYRYRAPLTPVLLLLAGPLLARIWALRTRLVLPPEPEQQARTAPDDPLPPPETETETEPQPEPEPAKTPIS